MSVEALLRSAVVRIEGGPKPGAGFLVAPGRVVTCVHVIGRVENPLTVRLGDDSTVPARRVALACDRGRPIPGLDEDYPDIAVLAVDLAGHPCVALDHDVQLYGDEFQAYGFPREGGSVLATPQILAYEGIKGPRDTPFIDLSSAKPVTGGMSGAPLLNLRTMAVCAILVASRSPTSPHGGLAVAWPALDAVFYELLQANRDFHARDDRWTAAGRAGRRRIDFGRTHAVEHFTGRSVELHALRQRLERADSAVITQAITGLGGVGKTQLAARYVECHRAQYDIVVWVHAEDSGVADLAALALTLGLPVDDLAPEERAAHALRWLEGCQERWLLILDNLAGPEHLDACCPSGGNGHVLVTTRNRDLDQAGPVLPIDVFDADTAADYLIARTGRSDERDDALALSRALRGLPLALAHAGAYCAKLATFAAYQQLLTDLPPRALFDRSAEAFYRQTVASTWQPSIIAASKDAPLAHSVLAMAAHLAPDAIPLALFDALLDDPGDARQRKRLLDAITALDRYSLADVHDQALSIHRLLQAVVHDAGTDTDLSRHAGHAALTALEQAMPGESALPEWWPLYEQPLPHTLALASTIIPSPIDGPPLIGLLNHAATYLLNAGAFQRSIDATTATVERAQRLLGDEHPDTLTARANLAVSYSQAGRTTDAIALEERVLTDSERLLGDEHPATLMARAHLAGFYSQAGRTTDAITLQERVLTDSERLLGDEHPNTITARANLASSYWQAGRTSDAIAIEEHVVTDSERLLGDQHPNTLTARANLAVSYWQAGRTGDAITIQEHVVTDSERLLGVEHPNTLTARANLAASYRQAGRTDESDHLQAQA